jgi:hypothetical protein
MDSENIKSTLFHSCHKQKAINYNKCYMKPLTIISITDWPETVKLRKEIYTEIVKDDRKLIYSHKVYYI